MKLQVYLFFKLNIIYYYVNFYNYFLFKNVFVNDMSLALTPKTTSMTLSSQTYCYKQKVEF